MNDSDFFCYCDFPTPSQDVIDKVMWSAHDGITNSRNPQFITRSSITPDQLKAFTSSENLTLNNTVYKRAYYRRYHTSPLVANWVSKNITPNFGQVGSQVIYHGQTFSPHTDGGPREYILNYIVETGGENVETQWFEEPGYPLVREPSMQYPDPSHLKAVKKVVFPKGSWTMLYGRIIHAVAGVEGQRVQLSIALSKEEFKRLKEEHNLDLKYYG